MSGLTRLAVIDTRTVREQFRTHVDPFIAEAFQATLPTGELSKLNNWSRSYYSVQGHIDSIMKFNKPILPAPTNKEWHNSISENFALFATFPKVYSLSAKTDFDKVKYHQGTSAGYGYHLNTQPNPTHKGLPNGPNHSRAKQIASRIVHECKEQHSKHKFLDYLETVPDNSTPDIAFTRTQLAELPEIKVRNVFGECFHYVILEGLTAQPLINMFMTIDSFYFIGEDPLTAVPKLINNLSTDDRLFLSLDWSAFDASVQPYEIEHAFDLLRSILVFPDEESDLVFQYVRQLFLRRKIASPDGFLYMRYGGIPSGSYFTHLIDSIINMTRIKYLLKRIHASYDVLKTHGDDALVEITSTHDDLTQLIDEASSLAWHINSDKTLLTMTRNRLIFLGRSSVQGQNFRDYDRCLRLLYFTEYPVNHPQISIARLKAIDEDSGFGIPMIPNVYNYLLTKYGDHSIPLPREFRRFYDVFYGNISI
ncbi:putative RNA-dependent RNA polymerase [Freshwater macrophyte associated partiti-like virus 2]|nr:putative RNA-dependent RNA polymerase [Freshwater macrophyte associated partiti-like virus 2]